MLEKGLNTPCASGIKMVLQYQVLVKVADSSREEYIQDRKKQYYLIQTRQVACGIKKYEYIYRVFVQNAITGVIKKMEMMPYPEVAAAYYVENFNRMTGKYSEEEKMKWSANEETVIYNKGCYPPNGTNLILKSPNKLDVHPAWIQSKKDGSSIGSGYSFVAVKKISNKYGEFLFGNIYSNNGGLFNCKENGFNGMLYVPVSEWRCDINYDNNIVKTTGNNNSNQKSEINESRKNNVVIQSKQDTFDLKTSDNKIHTKVDEEAEFPGGNSGWMRYLTREIERNIDRLHDDGHSGNVVISFIIDEQGSVSEVHALPCDEGRIEKCLGAETLLAKIAVDAIKKGPKWKPASQNGHQVKSYRLQTASFQLPQ